jgi:hypothetical protein
VRYRSGAVRDTVADIVSAALLDGTFLVTWPVQVTACYTTVYQVLKANSVERDVASYICVISGFRRGVDEICPPLGFHAAWNPKRAQISG